MSRSTLSLLALAALGGMTLCGITGCSEDVPGMEAKVTLSNPRVQRVNGEDQFLVDYEFDRGQPERGWAYRLALVSGSQQEYYIDRLLNETQVSGTIDGVLGHHDAADEPSRRFDAHFEVRIGSTTVWRTLSNTVSFETPAAPIAP